jgi:acyl-CoA reductase-like NAD-dependent aldehyde dehydrogenase
MPSNYSSMTVGVHSSAGTEEVLAAYDRSPIAVIETSDETEVEQALATAYSLYRDRSKWLPVSRRIEILEKTVVLMQQCEEELALNAATEGGKPLIDSRVEVSRAIDSIRICIECLRHDGGDTIPMGINAASKGKLAFTTSEPIGVVVAVSAFNHPLNLITHQVGPAVATGCPVIVKPANPTPLSCYRFVEILREAGLPGEWCQALVTSDNQVAEKLVTDKRVSFFSFIGSAKVGWMLRSKLSPGTRCALEHGGAAPAIVTEDADIGEAIPKLLKGGFYHAGQVCVSVQRIFVHRSIAAELAKKLAEGASALTVGDPTLAETQVGPLINPNEVQRVSEWVDEAVSEGAQLLTGGNKRSETCYECTVLFDPAPKSKVSTNEIFGPVVCVYPYDDLDQAITQANQLPFAFHAAIFSRNIDTTMYIYKQLDASAIMVNDHTAFRVDWMPFAGLRESGLGVGGIPYTFHDMQIQKMLVLDSKAII